MARRFCEGSSHRPPCRCVICRRTRTCWMREFKSPCCPNALGRTGLLRLAVRSLRPRCHARNRTRITLLLACTIATMNLALLRTWPPAPERPTSPCARRARRTTGSRKLRPTGPWHRQHPVRSRAPANPTRTTSANTTTAGHEPAAPTGGGPGVPAAAHRPFCHGAKRPLTTLASRAPWVLHPAEGARIAHGSAVR